MPEATMQDLAAVNEQVSREACGACGGRHTPGEDGLSSACVADMIDRLLAHATARGVEIPPDPSAVSPAEADTQEGAMRSILSVLAQARALERAYGAAAARPARPPHRAGRADPT
jgi:hypothetical protein